MLRVLCLLLCILLSSCSQEGLLEKFSSPEDQATARGYIDLLRAHKFDDIEQALDPSIKNAATHGTLTSMADSIPDEEPTSIKLVGAQSFYTTGSNKVNSTFEYQFGDKWLLANVAVQDKGGVKTIVGFNVYPQSQSLEAQNRFGFAGKGVVHYFTLTAAIAAVLLSLYALIICVRTKLPGRKWPWILFIVFGFGRFVVNWSTGQWSIAPLTVQLFSASVIAPTYGPWMISFSLPIGAIVFLLYKRTRPAPVVGS